MGLVELLKAEAVAGCTALGVDRWLRKELRSSIRTQENGDEQDSVDSLGLASGDDMARGNCLLFR